MTESPFVRLFLIAILLMAAHFELALQSSTNRELRVASATWVVSP